MQCKMDKKASMRGKSSDTSFWFDSEKETSSSEGFQDLPKFSFRDISKTIDYATDTDERALSFFRLPPITTDEEVGSKTVIPDSTDFQTDTSINIKYKSEKVNEILKSSKTAGETNVIDYNGNQIEVRVTTILTTPEPGDTISNGISDLPTYDPIDSINEINDSTPCDPKDFANENIHQINSTDQIGVSHKISDKNTFEAIRSSDKISNLTTFDPISAVDGIHDLSFPDPMISIDRISNSVVNDSIGLTTWNNDEITPDDPTVQYPLSSTNKASSQIIIREVAFEILKTVEYEAYERIKFIEFRRSGAKKGLSGSRFLNRQKLDKLITRFNQTEETETISFNPPTNTHAVETLRRRSGFILNKLGIDELVSKAAKVFRPISPVLTCTSPTCEGCRGTRYLENQIRNLTNRETEITGLRASMCNCNAILTQRKRTLDILREDITAFKKQLKDDLLDLHSEDIELQDKLRIQKKIKKSLVKKEISNEKKIRALYNNKAILRQRSVELEDKTDECNELIEDCQQIQTELINDASTILSISKYGPHDVRKDIIPGLQLLKDQKHKQHERQMLAHRIIDDKFAAHGTPSPFNSHLDIRSSKGILRFMRTDKI